MSARMLARSAKKGPAPAGASFTPTSRVRTTLSAADEGVGEGAEFFDMLEEGEAYASDGCSSSSSYADASDDLPEAAA